MATDAVPAAVPSPTDPPASTTPSSPTPGLLASMLAPVDPARPAFNLAPVTAEQGATDTAVDGASSATYQGSGDAPEPGGKTTGTAQQKGIWRAWLLAGATRWAKGGGTQNKRLDMKKAKAQSLQVKEARQVAVNRSGGLFGKSSAANGSGGKSLGGKSNSGAGAKGPKNSNGNAHKGPSGRSGGNTGSGPGASGRGGRGPGGSGSAGGNGGIPSPKGSTTSGGNDRTGSPKAPKTDLTKRNTPRSTTGAGGGKTGSRGLAGAGGKNNPAGAGAKDTGATPSGKDRPGKTPGSKDNPARKTDKQTDKTGSDKTGSDKNSTTPTTGGHDSGLNFFKKPDKPDKTPTKGDLEKPQTPDKQTPDKQSALGTSKAGPQSQKPFTTRGSRETGYRDGTRAAQAIAHAKAYRDGTKDGYADTMQAAEREKARLDKAHEARKQDREKEKPVSGAASSTDYQAKPIHVEGVTRSHVLLGEGAGRDSMTRGEVRSLKSFERRLRGKAESLGKVAESTKALKAHAEHQARKATKLLEDAKAVKGGGKLTASLAKLAEAAAVQAGKAEEINKRAVRAADACRAVLANVEQRYGGMYKAVVDSDETAPAELKFYQEA